MADPQPDAVHVALVQTAATTDSAAQRATVAGWFERLRAAPGPAPDLVVLPEGVMHDFGPADHDLAAHAEPLDGPFVQLLAAEATRLGATVVAGMFERSDDERLPYNTLVALAPDGSLVGASRKVHLYDSFGYRESDRLRPGPVEPVVLAVGSLRVGLMTCYDLRFPEFSRLLVESGADTLCVPAAWVRGPLKEDHWVTLLRARAIENTCWALGAAQNGSRLLRPQPGDRPARHRARRGRRRGRARTRRAGARPARRRPPSQPRARAPPGAYGRLGRPVTADSPAGRRAARTEGSGYAPVERRGLLGRMAHSSAVLLWLLAWGAGAVAAATAVVFVENVPAWVALWGGGLVTWLHTVALAHRVGARTWLWGALAALAIAAALVTERAWALAGISVLAAVVSGVVAVLLTRPAATALGSLFEFGWAMVVAVAGALAVAGLNAPVRVERYTLAVLCLALALAIGLVWQLGAGLHGMGRRGPGHRGRRGGPARCPAGLQPGAAHVRLGGDRRRRGRHRPVAPGQPARRASAGGGADRLPCAGLGDRHPGEQTAGLVDVRLRCARHRDGRLVAGRATARPRVRRAVGVVLGDHRRAAGPAGAAHRPGRDRPAGAGPRRRPPGAAHRRGGGAAAGTGAYPPAATDTVSTARCRPAAGTPRRCSVCPSTDRQGVDVAFEVVAEMVANVLTVVAEPGTTLEPGDTIVILESMKMEIPVLAEIGGELTDVKVTPGDVVQEGDVLAVIS